MEITWSSHGGTELVNFMWREKIALQSTIDDTSTLLLQWHSMSLPKTL